MKKYARVLTPLLSGVLAVGILTASGAEAAPGAPNDFGKRIVKNNKGNENRGGSNYEPAGGALEPGGRGGVDDPGKPGNGPTSKGDNINGNGAGQYDHKPGRDRDDGAGQNPGVGNGNGGIPDGGNGNGGRPEPGGNGGRPERGGQGGVNPMPPRGNGNGPDRGGLNTPRGGNQPNCCSQCGNNQPKNPNMGEQPRPDAGNNQPAPQTPPAGNNGRGPRGDSGAKSNGKKR